MKDFFTPMKIPQKWVCLLSMSFVFGQQAFSSENYVTESIAVSADIMQQKSKTVVGTVTDNGEPIIGASVVVKNAGKGVITEDRKSTRLNSSHNVASRMPSSA